MSVSVKEYFIDVRIFPQFLLDAGLRKNGYVPLELVVNENGMDRPAFICRSEKPGFVHLADRNRVFSVT